MGDTDTHWLAPHPKVAEDDHVDSQDAVLSQLDAVILASAKDRRQLPTERELCQSLGISRTALREHLQALEVVGLLRRDQGRGTFVQSPDGTALGRVLDLAMLADGVPPDDLMYVRKVLERESASLAAGRIPESAQARLRVLASLMRAPLPADEIADADHEFHMLLLQWSGNAALQLLGASLSQALHRSMRAMREFLAADRRAQLDMARAHDKILNAVVSGDHELAWREMDHHFTLNQQLARRIERKTRAGATVTP
jgi:GntR family transcriptional regulator, transcriptional repressor for pyruvate dehydrogenase complex